MKNRPVKRLIILAVVFMLFPIFLQSQEVPTLAGHWEGSIDIPGMKLEILIDFVQNEDGSWNGKISIPAQKAKDVPLSPIIVVDKDVAFEIQGIPGEPTFKGKLSDDGNAITGNFTQGDQTFSFSLSRAVSPVIEAQNALAGFDEVVERGLKELNAPGVAMAVVKGNQVIYAKGFGYRDVEKQVPMTPDTLLAIGSASKAFTTFAMGVLVDEGKLEWDKPVRNYIPWFRLYDSFASERLTPRDLVTHRSGLPRHDLTWYNNFEASREIFVKRLAHLKPTADLRETFQYNNLMFLTAGYLVEVLTEKKWEDAIRSHVFEPLGMERTNFSVDDSQKDENFALPYREREGKIEQIPFRNITNIGPAGSINSSVNEMSHWLLVHLNGGKFQGNQIIGAQTLQDMHLAHMPTGETPAIPEVTPASYGLGWFVDTYRGHRRVHHGGNIDGFSALVSMLPQDGVGFVALVNKNGTPLPELLVRHASDLILDLEVKDWIAEAAERKAKGEEASGEAKQKKHTRQKSGTKPAHKLEEYTGNYNHPGYGDLNVFIQKRQLHFTYNGITTPLDHWHYETFNGKRADDPTFEDMKLTFRTDVNGNVASLEAPFEPTLDPIAFQKKPDARLFDPEYLKQFVGKYQLVGQVITVNLKGNSLTAFVPGGKELDLVPEIGDEFTLKQIKIISLKFKTDKNGKVIGLELYEPDGVYEAERIED
jgi:CubicO group peptidase (beta-lactamase class C family)